MVKLRIGNEELSLATTLRVAYALRDICGAKNLQGAISAIAQMDSEQQLELLYAAYKAANKENPICKEEFLDKVLDNLGVFAIADAVGEVAEGLLYSGLTPEEVASKKAMVEKTLGATSSAKDTDTV